MNWAAQEWTSQMVSMVFMITTVNDGISSDEYRFADDITFKINLSSGIFMSSNDE